MPIVCALFFVSGFAALIYQMLWFRHLGFIFGNTVHAATTVVAAFMAGLALGAWIFGRLAHRVRHAVRLFGALELGVGLYALLMPLLFELLRQAYRWTYLHVSDDMSVLTLLRFALAFLLMLIPTTLMGGTLPLLSEAMLRRRSDFSRRLGWLYGINTLGAVSGVVAAGFFLIPNLGLHGTNQVAIAANGLIGLAALVVGRAGALRPVEPDLSPAAPAPAMRPRWILLASALAGFVALGFEVLWFRALILVFGSTTYSFCAMLAVFLLGIAIGSVALSRLADRVRRPMLLFAAAEIALGAAMWWSVRRFDAQAEFLLGYLAAHGFTWPDLLTAQLIITARMLLLPTIMMGLAFTVAGRAVRETFTSSARAVASVYTFNTVGCVLGSLCGGFLLLPWLGLEMSIRAMLSLALLLGLLVVWVDGAARPRLKGAVSAAVLLVLAGVWLGGQQWDHKLLSSGPYFGPHNMVSDGRVVLRQQLSLKKLVFYKEGVTATASVIEAEDGALSFIMDGKVEADTGARGMVVQRMIGHLPMLFHPNPRKVINLGLGAGVTLGSLGRYPVDWLEVVEIEPATTNVAALWAAYNHDVIHDPRLRVTINDGRNHFFCTSNRYDVITSDPYEPVVGGASHLFTVEHFRQAKACLAPGGIMGQWVPMYELSQRDFLAILRSFTHVFTNSVLFFNGVDIVMLGFRDEVHLDVDVLRRNFERPEVRESLAGVGILSPETVLGMMVAEMSQAPQLVGEGPLHTDGHPIVEFSAPKNALTYTVDSNQDVLLANFTDLPESLLEGLTDIQAEAVRKNHEALHLSLQANVANDGGDPVTAQRLLQEALERAPDHPVVRNEIAGLALRMAKQMMKDGRLEEAASQYQAALYFGPDDLEPYHQLVYLAMHAGQQDYAREVIDRALARFPQAPSVYVLRAKYAATLGQKDAAYADLRKALEMAPERPDIWKDQAGVARSFQDQALAERSEQEALRIEAAWYD